MKILTMKIKKNYGSMAKDYYRDQLAPQIYSTSI